MRYVYVQDNEEKLLERSDFLDDLRRLDVPYDYQEAINEIIGKVEEDIEELEPLVHQSQIMEMEELNREYRRNAL